MIAVKKEACGFLIDAAPVSSAGRGRLEQKMFFQEMEVELSSQSNAAHADAHDGTDLEQLETDGIDLSLGPFRFPSGPASAVPLMSV